MMKKKTHLEPFLLLLLLSITIRNSYANPIVAGLKGAAAINMVAGTEQLTKLVNYLVNIDNTKYDESIQQLERDIRDLPVRFGEDRTMILEGLYRAKARVISTRGSLVQAAEQLKSYVEELIEIYDDHDSSLRLLKYSAKKFEKYATFVLSILEEASADYKETSDELSRLRAVLKNFHYKLDEKAQESQDVLEKRTDYLKRVDILVGVFTLGVGSIIASPIIANQKEVAQENHDFINNAIDKVQNTLNELFNQNEQIATYVTDEIILIKEWKVSLQASLNDNHSNLDEDDVYFAIKHIRGRLVVLKDACINYLNHKLPGILQGRT